MNKHCLKTLLWGFCLQPFVAFALTFTLPAGNDNLIGRVQTARVEPGDNFIDIAQRFDVGYYELVEANPDLNPSALKAWSEITIPTQFILPPVERKGIVVNLSELRLYYFHDEKVTTFPVGVGRQGWDTPICLTTIVKKTKYPTWYVPESIRKERATEGVNLPKLVRPGPENPLGDYAMRLGMGGGTYLIHGTNDPSGVGRRSSSGCLRMFPDDIEELFSLVSVKTPVRIVDEPLKVGWDGTTLYLESHVPLDWDVESEDINQIIVAIKAEAKRYHVSVDWSKVRDVAEAQDGIPVPINIDSSQDVHAEAINELNHLVIEGSRADTDKATR